MKYEMGQEVWWARFESTEASIECPDCKGRGSITCVMGAEDVVTVDCDNCKVGFETFSRGRVKTYELTGYAQKTKINGMNVTQAKIDYRIPESYLVPEDKLFETEAEALFQAGVLAGEANAAELKKIQRKQKSSKSWAWNATYHRRCIRRAEKEIDYHRRKLDVANEKAEAQKKVTKT